QQYYGGGYEAFGYLAGDNIQWTGSHQTDDQFIIHSITSDNDNLESVWDGIYATINGANQVIAKVPAVTDPSFTQAQKNQLTGEGYFIRALAYFDLARAWGGVPITLTPTQTATGKNGLQRSTLAETYAQVLSDLDAADSLMALPASQNPVRANKETAWALKARYYLYQKDWANAELYAGKVLADNADYQLLTPFSSFFQPASAVGTKESIFELAYSVTYTNPSRNSWQPPATGGTRQWAPNDSIVYFLNNPAIGGGRSALIAETSTGLWYGNLQYRNPATDPSYIIRIAEVYLIRAEARAEQNELPGALADLDAVRTRAGVENSTAQTQEDILLAIENENRVEFALEPHRWFDLVRTGRAQAVLGITDPNKLVFPIPLNEIQLSNGSLAQNPGY
ncbi:MAG TPA: RagB/SusD family nutrient uptake outer membrane protein, partial [Dinghuibacter sp.]|uniref:RagB/SusD family nutrient uptake outer membrane protein n=1 Tax=Dinghuibacter sp. TaxID=2024697 RepID=UPI002D1A4C0E